MEPTDQEIIDYLLGDLAEPTRLEESLFVGDDFLERLSLVENRLIELYVLNKLTDSERKLFEDKYLISPRRKRAVATSTQFIDLLDSYRRKTSKKENWWTRLRSFFSARNFMWIQVPAAALLVLITTSFVWVLVDRTRLKNRSEAAEAALQRDKEAQRQASLREQQEREVLAREREELNRQRAEQQTNEESLRRREQELEAAEARLQSNQNRQSNGVIQSSFATFVLTSRPRSTGKPHELVIGPQDKFVLLIAYLEDEPAESYRASIERVSGGKVGKPTLLKPSGDPPQLQLVVPSSLFNVRDYFVRFEALPRSGQSSSPIEYGLTVKRIRR